ncbi:hypothetical protein [Nocardia sp. NPDC051832]|uniref:hypothetical protein n=1 Tax=Nocardia sp. NPDC051832 TaxID=3155673 RepID=UPI00341B50E6
MTYPQPEPYPGAEPYPGGSYDPYSQSPAKPPVPSTVQNAFYVMLAGAVLTVLSTLLVFLELDTIRDEVRNADPDGVFTEQQLDGLVTFAIGFAVAINLVSAGLWVWMAFANRAGKNWARITASVFFGLNALFSLINLVGAGVAGSGAGVSGLISTVVLLLIGAAAMFLLWHKDSAPYFKPAPPAGYGPPPGPGGPPPGYAPPPGV